MAVPEHRHFILQIALKCADLGNPCRPWTLSKRWSEQICGEFYRQGDYERQLNIPITPICNRQKSSMAEIQIGLHYIIIGLHLIVGTHFIFINRLLSKHRDTII